MRKNLLWYGASPLPGIIDRLEARGFQVVENPSREHIDDPLLGASRIVVINHEDAWSDALGQPYAHLKKFIDHGLRILVVAERSLWSDIRQNRLESIDAAFPWDDAVRFMEDWRGISFDNVSSYVPSAPWKHVHLLTDESFEGLTEEEVCLVCRAFPKAEQVKLIEIRKGMSGSRVFMAHEKRRKDAASISYWTQPRLVKIGSRTSMVEEVAAMRDVSPFVPFELRPNLDAHVEGFHKALFVADFVDRSEPMIEAARAGRAEEALSNLFNRTLGQWRSRGGLTQGPSESFASAAKRLGIVWLEAILPEYTASELFESAGIDLTSTWAQLGGISFPHRSATIHGDLHGENVRVRGHDAVIIDFGSVKGNDKPGYGAPLSFDVAMLEVALVFDGNTRDDEASFDQSKWQQDIERWYRFGAQHKVHIDLEPGNGEWLPGCLSRIRAFAIYEQSDPREYPLALAIAMLRLCKFPPRTLADKRRRLAGLMIAQRLIRDMHSRTGAS